MSRRMSSLSDRIRAPIQLWRSAHGQETPEGGKVRREVTQGVEQNSSEEKDREAIGQARREAQCEAHGAPSGAAPCGTASRYRPTQCTGPHHHAPPGGRAGRRARLARHERRADAPARRRAASLVVFADSRREQRAKSREQRAESKEQRAESQSKTFALLALRFALSSISAGSAAPALQDRKSVV